MIQSFQCHPRFEIIRSWHGSDQYLTPTELTDLVLRKVRHSFPPLDQPEAIRLLEKECARNLPFAEDEDAKGLDRVRLAVLKLARGNLDELRRQIEVAKRDWRDVIAFAQYPEAMKLRLYTASRLDNESRSELKARDRRQYDAWLGEGEKTRPSVEMP